MNAELLAVGSEILIGDICNTHSQYLSKQLALLGINLLRHSAVGDNPLRLANSLKEAKDRSDLVVITGGLGPTKDDLTKETVAQFCSLPLENNLSAQKRIENFFSKQNKAMPKNNLKQALIPKGALIFENDYGTAPGMAIDFDQTIFILLPGPPNEMIPMFEEKVVPYLNKFSDSVILSHNLHFFGISESKADEKLSSLLSQSNPTVGLYAKEGEFRIRVSAKASTKDKCEKLLRPTIEKIKEKIGDYLYGVDCDSLEKVVVETALNKNMEIAVAESCTGGMISSKIASIPGASGCFHCGIVSYSNDIKQDILGVDETVLNDYGAVSPQTAEMMAIGVSKLAKADIGVSVTGIAGPSGGSEEKPVGLVYVGIATESEVKTYKLLLSRGLPDERESIRTRSSLFALNAVRLELEKLSIKQ